MAVLEAPERVPNERLREHFLGLEANGITANDAAAWCGYVYGGRPDGTHLRRLLGLTAVSPDRRKGYQGRERTHIPYAEAVRICLAFGLDPVDLDL